MKKSMIGSKSKKSIQAPLVEPRDSHNPCEFVFVAGWMRAEGMPADEGGPGYATRGNGSLITANNILNCAISQMAHAPESRLVIRSSQPWTVFILSDIRISVDVRERSKIGSLLNVGSVSETERLADEARWIGFPTNATKERIANLALNEVLALHKSSPSIKPSDVLFLIWKSDAASFCGATAVEIGREVCDVVFTLGTEDKPAFVDYFDDDDDREYRFCPGT